MRVDTTKGLKCSGPQCVYIRPGILEGDARVTLRKMLATGGVRLDKVCSKIRREHWPNVNVYRECAALEKLEFEGIMERE